MKILSYGDPGADGFGNAAIGGNSRIYSISGTSPLMIPASRKAEIKEISIYGNSSDGKGVGDRTVNLFRIGTYTRRNCSVSEYDSSHIIAAGSTGSSPGGYQDSNGRVILKPEINVTAGTTVTLSADIEYISRHPSFSGSIIVSFDEINGLPRIPYVEGQKRYSQTVTVDRDMTISPIFSLNSSIVKISNIQVNLGAAALPYEPYGYKLPISISEPRSGSCEEYVFYTGEPLYTPSVSYSGALSSARYKNPTVCVNTEVTPSLITVRYKA